MTRTFNITKHTYFKRVFAVAQGNSVHHTEYYISTIRDPHAKLNADTMIGQSRSFRLQCTVNLTYGLVLMSTYMFCT